MTFTPPSDFVSRPLLRGTFGMAATTHWTSAAVAMSVLERGGNAFDAVVAAGFAHHLAEPHQNGPGGDMVALIAPAGGEVGVVVGQGPAPANASIEHYRSLGLLSVPGSGALAAAVPGSVEAWLWILREHGTWDIADVLEYALYYAEHGHPLAPLAAQVINAVSTLFQRHWPTSADLWLVDGKAPEPGTLIRNPAYARTLRRLLESAGDGGRTARIDAVRDEWKTGFVAEACAAFAAQPHRHADGGEYAGVIKAADFAEFHVTLEPALSLEFRGRTVHKASFWAQSPVLLQALAILDHFEDADLDPSTGRGAHTVIEALKLAMADRDAYYGDTLDNHDLLRHLISPEYARQRAALITERASAEFRHGHIPGVTPYLPPLHQTTANQQVAGASAGVGAGEPTVSANGEIKGDTVHLDVADRWGNMISATPSGGWLQSNPAIPELGFCLGTRLQMTWLDPESPSALVPGTRPRTTLSPTILTAGGETVSALGTPGGDQQDQWQLLYLLRTIVGHYSPQQAIDAPAFYTTAIAQSFWPREWTPTGVVVEDRLGTDTIEDLRRRGHDVATSGPWTLGSLSAVTRDPETGQLAAAASPRGMLGQATGR
jgi:gamma-glutamyltranspeptidase / glutathione hydrolase